MLKGSGITPAYAGNTLPYLRFFAVTEDHPRLRGEHFDNSATLKTSVGSPPPTRGTHQYDIKSVLVIGITPAYAGNTYNEKCTPVVRGDHPRLRGEHVPAVLVNPAILGSPPPTRGTQ